LKNIFILSKKDSEKESFSPTEILWFCIVFIAKLSFLAKIIATGLKTLVDLKLI